MASSMVFTQRGISKSTSLASFIPFNQHCFPGPFHEFRPHFADQDERRVVEVMDLEKLPRRATTRVMKPIPPGVTMKASDAIMKW
jgi:hypothetical protein